MRSRMRLAMPSVLHEPCVLIAIWASAAGVAARRARWCHWRSPSRACFAHVTCLLSNCLAPVPLSSSLSSRIDREGGYLPSRMARLLVPRPCTALLEFCFLLSFRVVFGMVYEFVCRIWFNVCCSRSAFDSSLGNVPSNPILHSRQAMSPGSMRVGPCGLSLHPSRTHIHRVLGTCLGSFKCCMCGCRLIFRCNLSQRRPYCGTGCGG